MEQARATLPERKKEERVMQLPQIPVSANPQEAQVKEDLREAGLQIDEHRDAYAESKARFEDPSTPHEEKAEIVKDLISLIEGDLEKIKKAREDLPGIQINERNPEYREAMDGYVKKLENSLSTLKRARLDYVDEYTKA